MVNRNSGFTFIEMLLAAAIFAFVGLASVAVLSSVTQSDELSQLANERLVQLQRTLARKQDRLVLCGLNEQPLSLMRRSGRDADTFGADNVLPDLADVQAALAPQDSVAVRMEPTEAARR